MKTKTHQPKAHRQGPAPLQLAIATLLSLWLSNAFAQPESFAPPILNPYGIVEHSGPEQVSSVLLSDIDLDGKVEAFVEIHHHTGEEGQGLLYYENIGDNHIPFFALQGQYPFGIINRPGLWPRQFVDIDGDNRPDLFFWAWAKGARVRMQRNVGSPHHPEFDEAGIVENPYGIVLPKTPLMSDHILDAVTPTFVDIDSDGDYDLFYGGAFFNGQPDEGYYFARNNDPSGNGTQPQFGLPERNPFNLSLPAPGYHQVAFVDQDCDGDYDLYTFIDGIGLYYHQNTGTPTEPEFTAESSFAWALEAYDQKFMPTAGGFLDILGDSDLDLICGSNTGVHFFQNHSEQQGASCLISGTELQEAAPAFRAYPNPAGNTLFFEMEPQRSPSQVEVEAISLTGQWLLHESFTGNTGQVNLEHLPPGMFILRVRLGQQWMSTRLVKK